MEKPIKIYHNVKTGKYYINGIETDRLKKALSDIGLLKQSYQETQIRNIKIRERYERLKADNPGYSIYDIKVILSDEFSRAIDTIDGILWPRKRDIRKLITQERAL